MITSGFSKFSQDHLVELNEKALAIMNDLVADRDEIALRVAALETSLAELKQRLGALSCGAGAASWVYAKTSEELAQREQSK